MKTAEFHKHVAEVLRKDPLAFDGLTEPEIPAVATPQRPLGWPWRARFRRFLALYSNAKMVTKAGPTTYRAYGVQYPDGKVTLWHTSDGYVDLHDDIAAMRQHYLRYGDFSIRFFEDAEQPG